MSAHKYFELKEIGPIVLLKPIETELVGRERISFLSDEMLEFLSSEKPKKVVLTLTHVTRYSSEAIGGLIRIERQLRRHGGAMKLCMNNEVREVFRVAQLDGNVFDIHDSESDAVAAFFAHGGDIFE